jgi:hypothetical protein
MAVNLNRVTAFAAKGFRVKRLNPDGTYPSAKRTVGFSGMADISSVLDTDKKADLEIKVGSDPWQKKTLGFDTVEIENFTDDMASFDLSDLTSDSTTKTALQDMETNYNQFDKDGINGELSELTPVSKSGMVYTFNVADVLRILRRNTANTAYQSDLDIMIAGVAALFDQQTVDISATMETVTIDPARLDVEQAVGVLEEAGFTGVTFEVEESTGRVKASAPSFALQIKGKIAAAMDFGQGKKHGGQGVYYKSYFEDEIIDTSAPKDIKEKENIDQESALGSITRIVIGSKILGASPVINLKPDDYDLKQIIQGGEYNPETLEDPAHYAPPSADVSETPMFALEVFKPGFEVNSSSNTDNYICLIEQRFWNCTGIEGEVSSAAKALAQYSFNVSAVEYTDEAGVKHPAWEEYKYTREQAGALDLSNV